MSEKRDVRLQVFVTSEMDDKITDIADLMGLSKNELIRYAIGTMCANWKTGVDLATKEVKRQLREPRKIGQVELNDLMRNKK